MQLPDDTRAAMLEALSGLVDGGYVELRTGSAPDPDSAATGTLLATLPLNTPAFSVSAGVATCDVSPEPEDNGIADGAPGWFRAYASDDTPAWDGEASEMTLSTPTVTTGNPVSITAWTLTLPDGS